MTERFSTRHGYKPPPAEIVVREDAPPVLRGAIPLVAEEAGMRPSAMRQVVCRVLLVPPDPNNWSEYPNIDGEVKYLVETCHWSRVYDIVEALYEAWNRADPSAEHFRQRINEVFVEHGIGWELRDGEITRRGSAVFGKTTQEAISTLEASGRTRAAKEVREALHDISRRPEPDVTGAMQHVMAALETTAREITGEQNLTLGKLVRKLDLPTPLDVAVEKLWGYASDRARHIRESQGVDASEAELIVSVAGALCVFLSRPDG